MAADAVVVHGGARRSTPAAEYVIGTVRDQAHLTSRWVPEPASNGVPPSEAGARWTPCTPVSTHVSVHRRSGDPGALCG